MSSSTVRPMLDPAHARAVKLVALDVDGVLTDGGIYLGDVAGARDEFKRYDIQDGLGIRFLRDAGLRVVIITGRVSESVRLRAEEVELDVVAQVRDAHNLPAIMRILDSHRVLPSEAAFVGDDFPDLAVLRAVALPVAVGNAVPEVKRECLVHLTRHGGRGAVREFAELLLTARGDWHEVTGRYVFERSAAADGAGW